MRRTRATGLAARARNTHHLQPIVTPFAILSGFILKQLETRIIIYIIMSQRQRCFVGVSPGAVGRNLDFIIMLGNLTEDNVPLVSVAEGHLTAQEPCKKLVSSKGFKSSCFFKTRSAWVAWLVDVFEVHGWFRQPVSSSSPFGRNSYQGSSSRSTGTGGLLCLLHRHLSPFLSARSMTPEDRVGNACKSCTQQ